MWYRAVGRIVGVVEAHNPQKEIKKQFDEAVARGDFDALVRLIDHTLSSCARELCFKHGLFHECRIVDERVISGEQSDYIDGLNEVAERGQM